MSSLSLEGSFLRFRVIRVILSWVWDLKIRNRKSLLQIAGAVVERSGHTGEACIIKVVESSDFGLTHTRAKIRISWLLLNSVCFFYLSLESPSTLWRINAKCNALEYPVKVIAGIEWAVRASLVSTRGHLPCSHVPTVYNHWCVHTCALVHARAVIAPPHCSLFFGHIYRKQTRKPLSVDIQLSLHWCSCTNVIIWFAFGA